MRVILCFILALYSLLPVRGESLYMMDGVDCSAIDEVVRMSVFGKYSSKKINKELARLGMPMIAVSSSKELIAVADKGSIFVISEDIDLAGKTVTMPADCILYINNGTISNGKIVGNGTYVIAEDRVIFNPGVTKYRGYKQKSSYQYVISRKGSLELSGSWSNVVVASKWTGLESDNPDRCQALALNNLVKLYRKGEEVIVPAGRYYIYDWLKLSSRRVDFSGSELLSIDFDKVEDKSIALPKDAAESPLKSRYGLIDINGKGSIVKNLTIDGRASTRDEEPALGRECLITIVDNSTGVLQNVTLRDAVDCAICTGAIGKYTFENVTIDRCGEHGVYLHGYRDTLFFKKCVFNNCSQSESLFKKRGISGCVRCNTPEKYSFADMAPLKMYFEDCVFSGDGNYKAATLYSDIPYAEFHRCKWNGQIAGYVFHRPEFNEATGQMCEYSFYDCDNPCGNHYAVNVKRNLVRCTNVRNAFEDTYIVEDCDIVAVQYDLKNKYQGSFAGEMKKPVTFRRCTFRTTPSKPAGRATISNPRPMVFEDCSFTLSGGGILGVENADITFSRCSGISNYDTVLNGKGKKNKIKVVKD